MKNIEISLVVPVYNEEENIDNFLDTISKVFKKINQTYEIIFVLDPSSDETENKIKDLTKVIKDPDVWNANIASRERMDELEEKLDGLISKISGISYIMRNLINNRKLTREDVQTHLDGDNNDNNISGSIK